jgi:hypothetical protein
MSDCFCNTPPGVSFDHGETWECPDCGQVWKMDLTCPPSYQWHPVEMWEAIIASRPTPEDRHQFRHEFPDHPMAGYMPCNCPEP